MFNKIYPSEGANDSVSKVSLAFLKSEAVKAFPSGRRRSTEIDKDNDPTNTTNDKYYIPFDPEARLNTEANARKHSSLNGYTQTYLKEWDNGSDVEGEIRNGQILLSLCGYLFDIDLSSLKTPAAFGAEIARKLKSDTATSIYANIILEDVHLYSSGTTLEYYTSILRDQLSARTILPSVSLDLLNIDESNDYNYVRNLNNYYFSGLSFSVEPLVNLAENETYNSDNIPCSRVYGKDSEGNGRTVTVNQQVSSLRLLRKVDGIWEIYQPAYLPKIEHGTTDDSIVVYGDTTLKGTNTHFKAEGTAEITGDTTIHSDLTVHNNTNNAKLTTDVAEVTGDLTVRSTIIATEDLGDTNNLNVKKADINTLTGEKATIGDIVGTNMYQAGYKVPIIDLESVTEGEGTSAKTFYQLKISRIGVKPVQDTPEVEA